VDGPLLGLVAFALLIPLIALRVPVAFAMAAVGLGGLIFTSGMNATAVLVGNNIFGFVTTFTFTSVPLFLLMGEFASGAGVVARAYEAARAWLTKAPGGLAMATVTGSTLFGATSGSGISAAAAMSRLTIPEMLRHNYSGKLAAGSVAASSTIAVLVPPSIILVLYGLFTNSSIGQLFLAAYIPGVISYLAYMSVVFYRVKRKPELAPRGEDDVFSLGAAVRASARAWGIVLLFSIIAGGIYFGFFSATESAAIAAVSAFLLYLFSGRASMQGFWAIIRDTSRITGMVFLVLVSAAIFSIFITTTRLAPYVAGLVESLGLPTLVFLALVIIILLIMGAFIDSISMMLLTLPVLLPMFEVMHVSLIWFGIILVKVIEVGGMTPPFGINVYVVKGAIGNLLRLEDVFSGIWWFVIADLIVIVILFAFPGLALWLPSVARGG
jgi:tripartite ATP-independent transporter DctM subunit